MGWGEQQQADALAAADRLASVISDWERHPSMANAESVAHHAAQYRQLRGQPNPG